ncbi:uncharacterized protein LOC100576035 [Acyrthosiphon pisum]|uniref:Chromo domain-containing protein n=1 Tax=Acyrthosiphon pisum TaxID=7029 RepID=A0A8R2B6C7_ACYPI|nr:uncharacterized protein LOC100576035 [Acyrthosiphon pisum]|eukprot:XP_008183799.1 PREDICTED: uncharacterized protein LOC100576035 [Acyrthosiphon pisum]
MDNLRLLLDYDDSSSHSTLSSDSDGQSTDDGGYGSVGDTSEPEEILVDKRYPVPQPPPPMAIPFVQIDGEEEPIINFERRPRRQEDRYHPYSGMLSRGYEQTDHPLRSALRSADLMQGTFNGFEYRLTPRRITGSVIQRRQLFYFVEWVGGTNLPFPLEAHIMARHVPSMVLRYNRNVKINPSTCRYL